MKNINRRRLVVSGVSLGALTCARSVWAQGKPPVVIGWLGVPAREHSISRINAFKDGMVALGWKEGVHYVLEERWAQSNLDRLPVLAEELAARKPAIVIAAPSPPAMAAVKAMPHIPVVMANGDPVGAGLAKSLARPGGMVTGLTNINVETMGKLVELVKDAMPGTRRVGYLMDPASPTGPAALQEIRRALAHFQMDLKTADAARPEDIEPALSRLRKEGAQALIPGSSSWFIGELQRIVKYGVAQRLPVFSNRAEFADAGALIAYGADRVAMHRRAAYFVDRILKGAKPADLPIEQPTKFDTVVNLKTATALGLKIPQTVMVRANRVIE